MPRDEVTEFLQHGLTQIDNHIEEVLKQTINTQPCIVTNSIAILEALKSRLNIVPTYTAGHSLGEYCAMYASGVMDLDTTLKSIQKRAELMNEIKIEVSHRKSLNYSQTQNGIKTIGYIRIINETAEDFGTVILKTEFSPEFSKGTETEVNLSPNARIEIGNYDVSVNGEYLANIAEKVVGSILFSVIGKVKDEHLYTKKNNAMETLKTNAITITITILFFFILNYSSIIYSISKDIISTNGL